MTDGLAAVVCGTRNQQNLRYHAAYALQSVSNQSVVSITVSRCAKKS
jgi:hypothetical protein